MATPLVTYAADGRVGIVSLNRADKLNAISPELKKMLVERFHDADRDPATSATPSPPTGRSSTPSASSGTRTRANGSYGRAVSS